MSKQNVDLATESFQEALRQLNKGEFAKAQEKFFEAIKHNPRHAESYVGLGLSLEKTGRPLESVAMYKKAIKYDPKNAVAVYNLGVVYLGRNKIYKAQRQFNKTLKLQPNNPNALHNLGLIYHNKKKYKKAIKYLLQAAATSEEKVYAIHYLLAKSFLPLERTAEAVFHLKKSLEVRTDFLPSLFELLKLFQEKGEWLNFFEIVRRVSKICPDNEVLHNEILHSLQTIKDKKWKLEGIDESKLDNLIAEFNMATKPSLKASKRVCDLQPKVLVAEPDDDTPRIYH